MHFSKNKYYLVNSCCILSLLVSWMKWEPIWFYCNIKVWFKSQEILKPWSVCRIPLASKVYKIFSKTVIAFKKLIFGLVNCLRNWSEWSLDQMTDILLTSLWHMIFLKRNFCVLTYPTQKFLPITTVDDKSALVHVMTLPKLMMTQYPMRWWARMPFVINGLIALISCHVVTC